MLLQSRPKQYLPNGDSDDESRPIPELYSNDDDDSCPPLEMVPSQVYVCSDDELTDDCSQRIVPIDSEEVTPSESLIPTETDPRICRFFDDITVMFNGVEDKLHAYVERCTGPIESSPGEEHNSVPIEPMPTESNDKESSSALPSPSVTYPTRIHQACMGDLTYSVSKNVMQRSDCSTLVDRGANRGIIGLDAIMRTYTDIRWTSRESITTNLPLWTLSMHQQR